VNLLRCFGSQARSRIGRREPWLLRATVVEDVQVTWLRDAAIALDGDTSYVLSVPTNMPWKPSETTVSGALKPT
jgi:hypothetical protein